jgi:hypothetical protein
MKNRLAPSPSPSLPPLPFPSLLQPFVGQPILAAAAFQAASDIILRTSPPSQHNSLSAPQRTTPPSLGCYRQPSLRDLSPARQLAGKSHLPARTPHHRQSLRRDGSHSRQRQNRPPIPSGANYRRLSNTRYTERREQIRPLPVTRLCSDDEPRPHAGDSSCRSQEMAGAAERVHRP